MNRDEIVNNQIATLKLYYEDGGQFSLVENKNMMLEDIDSYLSEYPYFEYTIERPLNIDIDMEIKVDSASLYSAYPIAEALTDQSIYQAGTYKPFVYASLKMAFPTVDGEGTLDFPTKPIYFFIRRMRRLSNSVTTLTLRMDTLNTFRSNIINAVGNRTLVHREHCDRFWRPSSYQTGRPINYKVDPISEQIEIEKQNTQAIQRINDERISAYYNKTWFLIYRSDTSSLSSISLDLVAKEPLLVSSGMNMGKGSNVTIKPSDLIEGVYYYLCASDSPSFYFEGIATGGYGNATYSTDSTYGSSYFYDVQWLRMNKTSGGAIRIMVYGKLTSGQVDRLWYEKSFESLDCTTLTYFRVSDRPTMSSYADAQAIPYRWVVGAGTTHINDVESLSIDEIDRRDKTLIKIIELPYAPVPFTGGQYFNPMGANSKFYWNSEKWCWSATDPSIEMMNDLGVTCKLDLLPTLTSVNQNPSDLRYIIDPKILHSDFTDHKLVYDSFAINIDLERCVVPEVGYDQTNIYTVYFRYKPSNTVNSNNEFMFYFPVTDVDGEDCQVDYQGTQDFANILLATRNNEIPIFTNDYINYIKTGFNYDKKQKALTTRNASIGVATSIVGGLVSGLATQNPVVGLVTAGLGATTSIASASIQAQKMENNIQKKLCELSMEATSVSQTDDINLADYYGGNELRYVVKQPNEKVREYLDDLFYYYGYRRELVKAPDWTSRYWFNFVQCTPVFDCVISSDKRIEELIASQLEEGVTYYHEHRIYDIRQVYENWESWMIS